METLGFFDTPTAESTTQWSDTQKSESVTDAGHAVAVLERPDAQPRGSSATQTHTLDTWQPSAAQSGLSRSNIRWTASLITLVAAVGLGVGAFLIYQRTASMADVAVDDVVEQAVVVRSLLDSLDPLASTTELTSSENDAATNAVANINAEARELFSLAGALPDSESAVRVVASDAASLALNATRRLIDVRAFYAALEPALMPPALETDSSLVDLAVAAQDFGNWRAYMTAVAGALPDGVSSGVNTQLTKLLASLDAVQSNYLDALKADGRFEATDVVDSITKELDMIRFSLDDAVSAAAVDIQSDIEMAGEKLDGLVS